MRALGAANFCKKGVTVGNKGRRITTVNSRRIFYSFPTTTGVRIKSYALPIPRALECRGP